MRSVATAVLACLVSSVAQPRPLLAQSDAGAAPMAGISNAGKRASRKGGKKGGRKKA